MRARTLRQRSNGHVSPLSGLFAFRHDGQLDPAIARQVRFGGRTDVRRRQAAVSPEILVEPVGVAGLDVVRVELIALPAETADALHPMEERRLDLVERSFELVRGGGFA